MKENKNIRLSVIIPIFNVEQYLEQCLKSFLSIDLRSDEYELLLVNDGTEDDSMLIAEKYAIQYHQIKLFTKLNGGLSSARNFGLDKAVGDYIWFFDSDDYLKIKNISCILDILESEKLDVIAFNWTKFDYLEKSEILDDIDSKISQSSIVQKGSETSHLHLKNTFYAHRFIFRREFFKINDFRFTENLYFEDLDLIPFCIYKSERIIYLNRIVYYYLQRDGSILKTMNRLKLLDLIEIARKFWLNMEKDCGYFNPLFIHTISVINYYSKITGISISKELHSFYRKNNIDKIYDNKTFIGKILNLAFMVSYNLPENILNFYSRFIK